MSISLSPHNQLPSPPAAAARHLGHHHRRPSSSSSLPSGSIRDFLVLPPFIRGDADCSAAALATSDGRGSTTCHLPPRQQQQQNLPIPFFLLLLLLSCLKSVRSAEMEIYLSAWGQRILKRLLPLLSIVSCCVVDVATIARGERNETQKSFVSAGKQNKKKKTNQQSNCCDFGQNGEICGGKMHPLDEESRTDINRCASFLSFIVGG